MQKHINAPRTQREGVEAAILNKFSYVNVFNPREHHPLVDKFKDGSFGLSSAGFALYSNGYNVRGQSDLAPFGLFYHHNDCIFSIGYFRKEGYSMEKSGYLFLVSPRGPNVEAEADEFIRALRQSNLPIAGFYVRFLRLEQFKKFLNMGYAPAKEHPWHPQAPEEDEHLTNSVVSLNRLLPEGMTQNIAQSLTTTSKNHRKHFRLETQRFQNFLKRTMSSYRFEHLRLADSEVAKGIVVRHFETLAKNGKQIGSTPEDYFGLVSAEILELPEVVSYLGFLNNLPVSLFICEKLVSGMAAAYSCLTLRDPSFVLPAAGLSLDSGNMAGFSAMPNYAYYMLFAELQKFGIALVHLGGSEHPDLDRSKEHMGAENDPTYWVSTPT